MRDWLFKMAVKAAAWLAQADLVLQRERPAVVEEKKAPLVIYRPGPAVWQKEDAGWLFGVVQSDAWKKLEARIQDNMMHNVLSGAYGPETRAVVAGKAEFLRYVMAHAVERLTPEQEEVLRRDQGEMSPIQRDDEETGHEG